MSRRCARTCLASAGPRRRRQMTVIAHTRRCLQQSGPYLSLLLMFVPLLLVEPLKFSALVHGVTQAPDREHQPPAPDAHTEAQLRRTDESFSHDQWPPPSQV